MSVRDYSSIYSIQDFFLKEIAPKYFPMEDVSLHNVGLYGMVTDIIGTTTEDSFNVTNRYVNEIMPARAQLPDFIYSNAVLYGVTDTLAKPARMPFILFVRERDIIENGTWDKNTHSFEIDSSTNIFVDKLPYSLPHNIVIVSTYFRGTYTHRAYYKKKFNNDLYKDINPYIRIFKTVVEKESWVGLRVDIYQYLRTSSTHPIITNSILNIPYVDISDYTNQLCNFEVLYKPFGKDNYIQLEKRLETQVPVTTPFVYYKIIDDRSYRLSFANDDRYFVPGYNSTLLVHTYETNGESGNFRYSENIDISVVSNYASEDTQYPKNISFFGLMKNDSKGGREQLTEEEIKRLYLEKMISINSFTTDTDLNLHYLNFAEIYNNNAIFIQYRDDYANREYGCFSRLTNGTDIYPTNTLDLKLDPYSADKHFVALRQYIVKPGRRYGYQSELIRDTVVPLTDSDEIQDIEYTSFALMVINVRPNSVHYYMNSVNKIIDLDYTYMNTSSILNFLSGECSIRRNAICGEDNYTISLELTRVDGVTDIIGQGEEKSSFVLDPGRLKVLMMFNTGNGYYVDMTLTNPPIDENDKIETYKYSATVGTNDMIDNGRISISNLINRTSGREEDRVLTMYNTDVKFCVFYNYEDPEMLSGHEYNDIDILQGYSLCNEYTPLENEFYFAYPLNLMRSHLSFIDDPEATDGWHFRIKQVPMFGKDFLLSLEDTTDVLNGIVSQHEFLVSSMKDITANFTINLKFYNTYGKSRLFHIGVDKLSEHTLLNKVHCSIWLKLKFYDGVIIENYLPNIKIFIKKYLEGLNMDNDGSNRLHMSVLIQKLHNEFECIELIIEEGFNGYGPEVQSVQLKSLLTNLVDPDTVPEFLTIKEEDIHISTIDNKLIM